MTIELRQWSEAYRDSFAEMQRDSDVMADQGGPVDRAASNVKFDYYRDTWMIDGISRWAVVDHADAFLGYAGVLKRSVPDHPLGSHYEIGWRFRRDAWGRGLATESARRALAHAWTFTEVAEIVSYTGPDNQRSQNVMRRLDLKRDTARDFTVRSSRGDRSVMVWVAERPT